MGKTTLMTRKQWDQVKATQTYNYNSSSEQREAFIVRNNEQVNLVDKRYEWFKQGDAVDHHTYNFENAISRIGIETWEVEAGVSVRGYFYLELKKKVEYTTKLIVRLDWRQDKRYRVYSVVGRIIGEDCWYISEWSPTAVVQYIKSVGSDDKLAVQLAEEFKDAVEFIRRRLMYEEV